MLLINMQQNAGKLLNVRGSNEMKNNLYYSETFSFLAVEFSIIIFADISLNTDDHKRPLGALAVTARAGCNGELAKMKTLAISSVKVTMVTETQAASPVESTVGNLCTHKKIQHNKTLHQCTMSS